MINHRIFKYAAENIANGHGYFMCPELIVSCLKHQCDNEPYFNLMVDYFYPSIAEITALSDSSFRWYGTPSLKTNQLARSLALLFMEQIAKEIENEGV